MIYTPPIAEALARANLAGLCSRELEDVREARG